jgi:outer membrane protein
MKKITAVLLTTATLSFYNCKNSTPTSTPSVSVVSTSDSTAMKMIPNARIAFVNMDSLKEQFTYYKQQEAAYTQKNSNLVASSESKVRQWQIDMQALQQKAQQGNTPPAQLQQEEQSLMKRQASIAEERDRKAKELFDETQKFNESIQKKLTGVLAQIQKEKGFDYVMSHVGGGASPLLYVNEKLDITKEVVTILNADQK